MNPTRPFPFLWDCEVKNKRRRDMFAADSLELNFEIKKQDLNPDTERTLCAALGLSGLRLVEATADNTRWTAVQTPDMFYRRLAAWEMLMLLYGEQAIAIGYTNVYTKQFEGVLFAQARYAYDWGAFDPKLFTRFEENQHA